MARIVQIRTYTVRPERLDEWALLFRTKIVPLRRSLGFEIGGSWIDRERSQHIWVIIYDGPLTFEQANAAYWASPEREALGVDPAAFLTGEEVREVTEAL